MTGRWLRRSMLSFLKVTVGPLIKMFWLGPISGLENIPAGPAILIVNHSSYMDFLVLGTACELLADRQVHFWANHKITRRHPLFRHLAAICEAIPVDRRTFSGQAWRTSLTLLEQGRLLAIFPEGTRSRSGELQPFNAGYLKLAAKAAVPVVPVRLAGAFDILPPHRRWPLMGHKCSVTVHPPLALPPGKETKTDLETFNRMVFEKYYRRNKS